MPDIIRDIEQGSPAWHQLRCASIGGTAIGVIQPAGTPRREFLKVFAGELLTGVPAENKKFKFADRGNKYEDDARQCFSLEYGIETEQVAMIKDGPHKHHSPDDIVVGEDSFVEYKVRLPSVFVGAIEKRHYPTGVKYQNQWGLCVSKFKRCFYVQYCPEFAEAGLNPLIVEIIGRDEPMIKDLRSSADVFISDAMKLAERIKNR